ncbi:MAG: ABC-type transporter, ATPase component [Verrucomicrobiota bacterium]|jgi:ABC-2 type transport system ATP-binding protein
MIHLHATAMIELEDISIHFSGRPVLQNLSLRVPPGRIFGILGGNGAGKSTMLNIILGFLKADSGCVRVDGIDPGRHAAAARAHIAYIPESVALYPELSGEENLAYFAGIAGCRLSTRQTRALLNRVGLHDADATRRLGEYSKGMRQRVALALALARKASVLLLDEPTTGLDPEAATQLAALLRELSRDGAAVLLTTHDLWHLSLDTDDIGILRCGRLTSQFQAADLSPQHLAEAYLKPL